MEKKENPFEDEDDKVYAYLLPNNGKVSPCSICGGKINGHLIVEDAGDGLLIASCESGHLTGTIAVKRDRATLQ